MRVLFLLIFSIFTLFAMAQKEGKSEKKIDDWDYNVTSKSKNNKISRNMPMIATQAKMMSADSIGFSVGGAKDADNFYENIKNGYLPKLSSLTYEGVFYDHYFKSLKEEDCESLFCPSYKTTSRINPYTKEKEYFLSVGLNSNIKAKDFERKKLNIVVVLDISGSMNAPFDKYYYDNKNSKNSDEKTSKMQIANRSLVNMIEHLKDEDRLGIVLFDNSAYLAKPLRLIKNTKIEATKKHILELKSRGGTNWSEGYKKGLELFGSIKSSFKDPKTYENRVIFLTDAMPNRGELSRDGLFGLVKGASEKGIYTTFIGVGVDFNNDLVESISKTKGANYFAVHSNEEFSKRLDEEFDFMVTPLVFDLALTLKSTSKIEAVYGSPDAKRASGEIMYVNTLFPSPTKEGRVKGGIILLKLSDAKDLALNVSYLDRLGKNHNVEKKISFKDDKRDQALQKAILLSDYVTLLQNWMLDMREGCQDKVIPNPEIMPLSKRAMIYPPTRPTFKMLKTWERKSCELKVSDGYKKLLSLFQADFKKQSLELKNDKFKKELDALSILLSTKEKKSGVIDDWESKR
jgi:Ca-activated chloride channel family protein